MDVVREDMQASGVTVEGALDSMRWKRMIPPWRPTPVHNNRKKDS